MFLTPQSISMTPRLYHYTALQGNLSPTIKMVNQTLSDVIPTEPHWYQLHDLQINCNLSTLFFIMVTGAIFINYDVKVYKTWGSTVSTWDQVSNNLIVIKNYKSKNKNLVDNDKHMEFSKKLINSLFPCYSNK
jgi:hypothetical protein